MNKEFTFKNKRYETVEQFAAEFDVSTEDAVSIIEALRAKGLIADSEKKSKQHKALEKAVEEIAEVAVIDQYEQQQAENKTAVMAEKSGDVYKEVRIPYATMLDATSAEQEIRSRYGIETASMRKDGKSYVVLYNVPSKICAAIEREYKVTNLVQGTIDKVTAATNVIGDITDIAVNKVAAPLTKTALKVSGKTAKSATKFLSKTLANLVSTTGDVIRETRASLSTDPDVLSAKREIISAKDSAVRTIGKLGNGGTTFEVVK